MSEREDDPWKDIEAELLRNIGYPLVTVADLRADTFVARFFAARAAEATQHQQEIAAKDAIIKQQAADLKVGREMQDRETALKEQENAREWQAIAYGDHPATWAALAYYRERGWPVDVNTFPERDRCENRIFAFKAGYAAALASPLSAPPQEPTGAKRHSLTDWIPTEGCDCDQCTAAKMATLKSISGSSPCDDMGEGWFVTVGRFGASFVTLEETHLGGKPYFTPEDKALVRGSARHLLSFIGELEPTGASPQAETSEDEDDVPAVDSWSAPLRKPVVPKILSTDDFYALLRILEVLPVADPFLTDLQAKLSDEERRQHGNRASHLSGPEFVREIERIEALIQSRLPAPVSPVEPTPEPPVGSEAWRQGGSVGPIMTASSNTPAEPETCEWRIGTHHLAKAPCFDSPWFGRHAVATWNGCPYCLKPLRLVPSEER